MQLPKQLTTVTTFSKLLALVLFISFPIAGFWMGTEYQRVITTDVVLSVPPINPTPTLPPDSPTPTILDPEKGKYCQTLDEKQCYESAECIPSYGPSCTMCQDIRYSGCVYSSTKKDNKILCANTGGVWDSAWNQEDGYSRYKCECPISEGVSPYDVVFSTDKGCVAPTPLVPSVRDICEKNGGYWNAKSECENIGATACGEMNGNYNNCASPCRYAARKESCEKINNYCVQLCTIK